MFMIVAIKNYRQKSIRKYVNELSHILIWIDQEWDLMLDENRNKDQNRNPDFSLLYRWDGCVSQKRF